MDPRPHLLPDYDPAKAKVAQLRGLLLEHDIPYSATAKKSDLVKLFEKHIRPQAAALLAQSSAVRPSDRGILDGDSQNGSLKELDTDSEDERRFEAAQESKRRAKAARKSLGGSRRKSLSAAVAAVEQEELPPKSARKKGKGRAREEEEESAQSQSEVEEREPSPPPKQKKKGRKSSRPEPVEVSDVSEDEVAIDEARAVSPKKRKAEDAVGPATPRVSELTGLKAHLAALDNPEAGNFSDFNPFQSGGEDTPARDAKRRKSSLGPDRLKSRKSMPALPSRHSSSSVLFSADLPSAKRSRKSEIAPPLPSPVPPLPSTSASSFFAPAGGAGLGAVGTPGSVRKKARRVVAPEPEPSPEPEPEAEEEEEEEQEEEEQYMEEEEQQAEDVEMMEEEPEEDDSYGGGYEDHSFASYDEPAAPPTPQPVQPAASISGSTGTTPVGRKFMVPVSQVKTTPPHLVEQLKQYAASTASAAASPAPARQSVPFQTQEHRRSPEKRERGGETRTVSLAAEEKRSRRSEPISRSPSVALGGHNSGAGTPRRSLPVSASERQVVRAAPAPDALQKNKKRRVSDPIVLAPKQSSSSLAIPDSLSTFARYAFISLLALYALWYRSETFAVGFCDSAGPTTSPTSLSTSTDSSTLPLSNSQLETRSSSHLTSLAYPSLPSLPPSLLSFLDSTSLRPTCTPCPSHALCASSSFLRCIPDYVPRPSLLRSLTLGLVPRSPHCEADTEKQVAVARVASNAGRVLRRRRGEVRCERRVERARGREARGMGLIEAGEKGVTSAEKEHAGEKEGTEGAYEAFVYGLEAERVLKALARENEESRAPLEEEVLEEISRLAMRDLEMHGEVVVWQNGETTFYASRTADMPLTCRARLAALRSAKKHKLGLSSVVLSVLMVLWARQKVKARMEDRERVKGLVQSALRQLQLQERAHNSDAASTPYPHLAPSHLRDLLLTSLHSPSRRAALWAQVEKVVEGNANVRVGEVEVGGEEMRGWSWVGPRTQTAGEIEGIREEMGYGEGREMIQVGGGGTPGRGTPRR